MIYLSYQSYLNYVFINNNIIEIWYIFLHKNIPNLLSVEQQIS